MVAGARAKSPTKARLVLATTRVAPVGTVGTVATVGTLGTVGTVGTLRVESASNASVGANVPSALTEKPAVVSSPCARIRLLTRSKTKTPGSGAPRVPRRPSSAARARSVLDAAGAAATCPVVAFASATLLRPGA